MQPMIDQLKKNRILLIEKQFDKAMKILLTELINLMNNYKLKSHNQQNNSIFFENGFWLKIVYYYGTYFDANEITEVLDYLTQEGSHLRAVTS